MTKNFSQCGAYSFTVGADEGYRLKIDGVTYIDNWNYGGYRTTTAVVYLTSGNHNLEIEYYEGGGGNRLSFSYASLDTWSATASATNNTICYGGSINLSSGTTGSVTSCNTRTNTPNAAIPDNNATGVNGYVQIQGSGVSASAITSVAVNITHPYNADVVIRLYAPDGSSIIICGDKGGSGDNITATFLSSGTTLPTGNVTINGNYQVEQPFSGLTGSADGLWRLNVLDNGGSRVGTFNSWTLTLNSTCAPTYSWTGPNSFSSTSQNPTRASVTTSDAGTYTVSVTQGGCTKTNTVNITVRPALDPSSAAVNLASCQLNSTAPYADLTANAAPSGAQGTWAVTTAPGTVTSPNANNTQVTGLSNTGATSTLSWSLSYTSGLACTVAKTGINIKPLNLATTLNSVSLQNDGAASSTGTPAQTRYACRTCSVKDGNTYTYYDAIGKIIATIVDTTSNAADLGSTEVCIGYDYTPPTAPNSGNVKTITDNFGRTQPYLPRSWTIKPAAGSDATVTLYFTADELSALQSRASTTPYAFSGLDLAVTKYPGGTGNGQFIAPKTAGGVFTPSVFGNYNSDYKVTFDVNSFSTFYVHPQMYPFAPLPVELVSFTGYNDKDKNVLNWATASELNSNRFEIEKSIDGSNWQYIGMQKAAGTTNSPTNYTFYDNMPVMGNNYYRLKIVDNDASYEYSNIINIQNDRVNVNEFSRVYPNPTSGNLNVEIQSTANFETNVIAYDLVGKKIYDQTTSIAKGLNTLQIDFSNFASGVYVLQFSDVTGNIRTTKFVKE
jgi:subtilisin-like proprotein convertase family protein